MIKVEINGKTYEYPNGITFAEIAAEHQKDYPYDILLGVESGNLRELHRHLTKPGKVDFLTAKHIAGLDTYKRTVLFLLLKSIHDICPQEKWGEPAVKFSLQNSLFIEMIDGGKFTKKLAERIDAHLKEIVEADLPIRKRSIRLAEAMDLFREKNRRDKTGVFRYRRVSRVNLYELGDYQDYFYGYMLPSTKYAKYYRLDVVRGGLFLTLPTVDAPDQVDPPDHQPKVFNVLKRTSTWAESMNLATIGDLNDAITRGEMQQIVLMQEAAHEGQLSEIAQKIVDEKDRKIIMIAGPSSSGKTTTSHRLAVQLRTHGLNPHPIACDNYFVNRDDTPVDENGKKDYENLNAIDVEQFNDDINALLEGKEVELPSYNFITGKREYNGDRLKLGDKDILVIEGIHCLNDALSYRLPMESRYRIYISAMAQVSIDSHNRIPSSDGRLIRRIVRDARTRGNSAQATLAQWESVQRGERKNIYPYRENADVIFNSALIYELPILKVHAEPLLFNVPEDSPEYFEAKRLLKFFDYVLGGDSMDVPYNSLLREFVGGGIFKV